MDEEVVEWGGDIINWKAELLGEVSIWVKEGSEFESTLRHESKDETQDRRI